MYKQSQILHLELKCRSKTLKAITTDWTNWIHNHVFILPSRPLSAFFRDMICQLWAAMLDEVQMDAIEESHISAELNIIKGFYLCSRVRHFRKNS